MSDREAKGEALPEGEVLPKKLSIRGEARVPKKERRPKHRPTIEPYDKYNWLKPAGVRHPNSVLGSLMRKYWPDLYTTVPNGRRKLAWFWADYEASTDCPGFESAADAVISSFWVFYQVTPEHQEAANATLLEACRKLTTQQWYNTNNTLINHFQAEHGLKIRKDEIARGHKSNMSVADFMTVMPMWCEHKEDAFEVLASRWIV